MNESKSVLVFFVNGKKIEDKDVDPEWTLSYYLRKKLRLCGTKISCSGGGCGACTVMISKYDRKIGQIQHLAVYACLMPICSIHGWAITTVEGIGSLKSPHHRLHPVQERIAKAHGSQCGFCTPGIVMSMYTLLRNNPRPSMFDLDVAFKGNLCRCTGYRPIIEGYRSFTEDNAGFRCPLGPEQCCQFKKITNGVTHEENKQLFNQSEFVPYNPSQEPIFPPELKLNSNYDTDILYFKGKNVQWIRPNKLKDLLAIKFNYPDDSKIVVGNSEIGVETKLQRLVYPILIHPVNIEEMNSISTRNNGIQIGASVTYSNIQVFLKQHMKIIQPAYKTRLIASIIDMLYYFAGKQIRNVASVGGNIMTASPISDLIPIFTAANCILEVCSKERGKREITMDNNFFTNYRKNIIQKDEVILAINIPYSRKNEYFYAYKHARRRNDDVAVVNCAVHVTFKSNTTIISNIQIVYGGIGSTIAVPENAQKVLVGKEWNEETLECAYQQLNNDLHVAVNAPGGNAHYRQLLTLSLFFRAYLAISQQLEADGYTVALPKSYKSASTGFNYTIPRSSQYFEVTPNEKNKCDLVGQPVEHVSAFKQASGEAIYCDDLPELKDELYMGVVLSTEAHAEIISIDESEALKMEGVYAFYCAKDLPPEQNSIKSLPNEEVFVSKITTAKGQLIGVIIADNQNIAQRAAKKVKVDYRKLSPVIVTLEQAIEHKSFFNQEPVRIVKGSIENAFKEAFHIIEGECRTGGQEHFYLETHSVLVNPKLEDDEFYIISSTQRPQQISDLVAEVLNIPINRIVTKINRIGGGFGGKESRSVIIALPAAVAAYKLKRPIRCVLDRDEDMSISGTRHPFLLKYKTSFTKEGKITGCLIKIYNNAGYSSDLSKGVLDRALFHFENSYKIENVDVQGWMCKTNLPSNTAFRGFGGPQGMFSGETMVREIAEYLNKDIIEIQELNLYNEGDVTHYNQKLENCTVRKCWNECITMSDYYKRKSDVEKFNRENRWKKRGLALVPSKHGIAFTLPLLNQGGALIMVYLDGSVLLTHGGVEMGQGLHTKMIQIASKCLNIPMNEIFISESATDKVPNASPTAASSSSDIYGLAVKQACEKIMKRLEPYRKKNPNGQWKDWILDAYKDRVGLSATGFYGNLEVGYNFATNSGKPFNYFTYGVACSEVEIDCLTGDHQVLCTNIVMDLGESLNPAIDIGQIEGAFIQGYGLFTMEEMLYSPNGDVLSTGLASYSIPGFANIPTEFNVSLLKGVSNPHAIFSSKATGEPPLFLASSILFAIREAIKSARHDANIINIHNFKLDAPATAAKIRMLCEDNFTSKVFVPKSHLSTTTPWNVIP